MPKAATDAELLEFLYGYVSEHKQQLFENVLAQRTRHLTIVLENIYQPHNASAVLRTCELLGVQDVHIIEDNNTFELSTSAAQGSAKWLDLYHYAEAGATKTCAEALKAHGYQLACATPHATLELDDLDVQRPLAICFGTELRGVSDELVEACDVQFKIPMYGFTESYNISVSAAIVLFQLLKRMRDNEVPLALNEAEKQQVRLLWAERSIKRPDLLQQYFNENKTKGEHLGS